MIDGIRKATGHAVRAICATLGVPRSSYYHAAAPSPTRRADLELGDRIEEIFKRHRRRYGYRRIHAELRDQGLTCAPARVWRIMAERGLRAIQPKTYVPRTSDGRADKPSPNLLLGQPLPTEPDRVWAGDITFIPTSAGWRYLAVIIDLCSRRVVGWAFADNLCAGLVTAALRRALASRTARPGLIFHSDRGSQYGSAAHRRMLAGAGILQSMSARANPYHNAWTESFIGTLKNEMLQGGAFADDADALIEIFDFIESYYNRQRKHSALGYQAPAQFEAERPSDH
jgi:transposase InsO family protein